VEKAYLRSLNDDGSIKDYFTTMDINFSRIGFLTSDPLQDIHLNSDTYINGKLGINIKNPQRELDVVGNINIPETNRTSLNGIIYKSGQRFLQDFVHNPNLNEGVNNLFLGRNAGIITPSSNTSGAYASDNI